MAEQNPECTQDNQRKRTSKKQRSGTRRLALQYMECRNACQTTLSGSGDERRLDIAVLSRDGDCQIGQQIQPKPQGWKKPFFIAGTVAKQLQGLVTIRVAKMGRIEAQEQGVHLLRHSPPSRSSWRARHATSQQAARPRSVPICVQLRSADNIGGAHGRV